MRLEEALELLQFFVSTQTRQHLNTLQIAVLRGAWENQTYEQIAETYCFSSAHAKTFGAKLWDFLSQILGTKVNKKNFSVVLERKAKEWATDVATDGVTDVADKLSVFPEIPSCTHHPSVTSAFNTVATVATTLPEVPSGQVPLDSPFYIQRPPIEQRCYDTILQPGALIRIHSPQQMGKTSLMARILHQARVQSYRTVTLSLHLAEKSVFTSLDRFLQWFCASVGKSLGLPNQLADYWDDILGSNASSTDYFENYLLAELNSPIVIGLDELDILFQYPDIASDFFSLLRTWHEIARYGNSCSAIWQKLRVVVVYSTDVDVPSSRNRSPFNIGLLIKLPEFTREQVHELAQRRGLNWNASQVEQLMSLVGGHPYLIHKALYHIGHQDVTLEHLLPQYVKKGRIYGEYLRQQLANLQQHPQLYEAFAQVASSPTPIELERVQALKLHSMGLVHLQGSQVMPSCNLYRHYFSASIGS
ncbi:MULTISPECIES: AAA-like domain-containing protein [unclassified Coleofasciculus]|uniref:AAA-like domain-containing protein n=1 Tax=unclassified Coleofasciculus TaxID=2692782 RepID=UPI00187F70BE|nr:MULTISPECIES: AAA-like domain-containing protein [unclassified Coleofasciculus]MBE9128830.1 AAA-like domain-containing protein [Coleofasciculus sp. LEGE 07081]MBE9148486.1 AAA-like domain-containing protein [Coleofasciculus sp. LEGE 07092]